MSISEYTDAEIKCEYNRRFPKKTKTPKQDPNTPQVCSVGAYTGPRPKTATQAQAIRAAIMTNCGCTLCHAALNPCLTFEAQAQRVGRSYPDHGETQGRWEWNSGKNPNRAPKADDIFPLTVRRSA